MRSIILIQIIFNLVPLTRVSRFNGVTGPFYISTNHLIFLLVITQKKTRKRNIYRLKLYLPISRYLLVDISSPIN